MVLELPESHTISKQLRETVGGKTIRVAMAAQSPHGFAWYSGDPMDYPARLNGKQIDDIRPNAGQVECYIGALRLVFNDGVNVRYLAPGAAPPQKHQLYLCFNDDSAIVCTVQMYGGMLLFEEGTNDNFYYLTGKEKPSPLTDGFDRVYFDRLVRSAGQKLSVKALLATEQRIPGLGNGCLQDILYFARVNPMSRLSKLSDADYDALYGSIKSTLSFMAEKGGRDTEKDLFGKSGGYKTTLSSKTVSYPCPGCGGVITRKAYMGGNVYYCESCQPIKK